MEIKDEGECEWWEWNWVKEEKVNKIIKVKELNKNNEKNKEDNG
jgi:hypothetical protein